MSRTASSDWAWARPPVRHALRGTNGGVLFRCDPPMPAAFAARFARENQVPYLGLCLGVQVMVIELARHALGSDEPNSAEFDIKTAHPVIDLMADQRDISDMGGTMRLGLYPCRLVPGSRAAEAYGEMLIHERHRHRWEVNNAYRDLLAAAGMIFSGLSPDGRLVEICEMAGPIILAHQGVRSLDPSGWKTYSKLTYRPSDSASGVSGAPL